MKRLLAKVRQRFVREEEWREEVQSHLAMRTELNRQRGMAEESAREAAHLRFGNATRTLEDIRSEHIRPWMETLFQDIRYAARGFRRAPVFTLVAVATLTIGIGATTAVFSVVDRLLFRSLPYTNGDRLVSWGLTGPIDESEFMLGSGYVQWRDRLLPFQAVTSFSPWLDADLGDRDPVRVRCIPVEGNFLATLGLKPMVGRDFTRDDDLPNAQRVALVSYGLWKSRFGGSPASLNQTFILDDQPARLIGVLPKDFELPTLGPADVLIPQQLDAAAQLRSAPGRILRSFARLKDGISIPQAKDQLQPFLRDTLRGVPPELRKEVRLVVRSVRDRQISDVRLTSWMLFGAVAALLLIACANVANLLLARVAARRQELAMRAALGAGRGRLIRQGLTESVSLAVCGGIAGCAFSVILLRVLKKISSEGIFRLEAAKLDIRVLLFTLATCLIAAVLFGLLPALERPRAESLTGWHAVGSGRDLMRHLLIASQIAISLVLLTGASLLVRSLWKLESQPIGLEPENLVTASFELGHHRYNSPQKLTGTYNALESRLKQVPGVAAFGLSDSIPPGGWMHARPFSNMAIVGRPPLPSEGGMVAFRYITPDYFRALRIHLTKGRAFNERDRTPSQNSIILDQKLAQRMFRTENPLGQQILLGGPRSSPYTVVGVAAEVKNNGLANAADPEYYLVRKYSNSDMPLGYRAVAVFRSSQSPATLAAWIRAAVTEVDKRLPVVIETMHRRLNAESGRPRLLTVLIGLFAVFGLAMAAIGLFGVMAFLVGQRTREIGVRIAVGATRSDIMSLVLKHAASWTAVGMVLGIACSLATVKLTRGLLFEMSPYDPISLSVAIGILAVVALLASWWPSQKAAQVDPAISLRYE